MKKVYVIGVFPPPYGGATIKCKLFCELLENNNIEVENVDLLEGKRNFFSWIIILFRCMMAYSSGNSIVYSADSKRLKAMLKLQAFFPNSFSNTTVLTVGGLFHNIVKEDAKLANRLGRCKGIWVETEGMKKQLNNMGFNNCIVFPNPKSEKDSCEPIIKKENEPLRLVYFSQISREKGIDEIFKAVELLKHEGTFFELDFYGHIVTDLYNEFQEFVKIHQNVKYCGVFDATKSCVYKKLNEYDILLFPTKWDTEGIPGILVEAKMSGLAVVASDRSYNSEIIKEDNYEGILLKENYAKEIAESILRLAFDAELLSKIKYSSYESRKRYSVTEYMKLLHNI